jgi:hypothetical protein
MRERGKREGEREEERVMEMKEMRARAIDGDEGGSSERLGGICAEFRF